MKNCKYLDVQFKLCTGGRHIVCLLLHLLLSVGGTGEPGHLQNRGPRVVSIDSTEFHFAFMLWMSSWSNRSPALSDPGLHLKRVCDLSLMYHLAAGHSLVGVPDDVGQLVRDAVVCQQFSECLPVQAVERLFALDKIDEQR